MIIDEKLDFTWREQAACANADTEMFFPPRDKTMYRIYSKQAKEYCNGPKGNTPCPVRANCLWEAIVTDEQHGIWGGLSHRERNALVRKWQKHYKGKMSLKQYIYEYREANTTHGHNSSVKPEKVS